MTQAILQINPMGRSDQPDMNDSQIQSTIVDTPIGSEGMSIDFSTLLPDRLSSYWQLVQQYPLLEALIIVCFAWLLAYFVRRYVIKLIEQIAGKTETNLDDKIIAQIRGPVFSTVIWIGINIAWVTAGLAVGLAKYITPIIMTIVTVIWLQVGMALSTIIFTALSRDPHRFKKFGLSTEPLLIIVSKILVLLVASYSILLIWGINPVGLLASAGIVGIAVGFAAKDSLANLFSGVFILADRPYKLGDYINLDSGERGKVTHIGIRSTRLMTRDDIEISIPNGVIGNAKIINESGGPHQKMRIRVSVQVAYQTNLEQLDNVLMGLVAARPQVCDFPEPRVRVRGFADSGIDVQLLCWIDEPESRGLVSHLLYEDIHKAFAEHDIEIPYPRRDVHLFREDNT